MLMTEISSWLTDHRIALWTIVVGVAAAVPCGVLGCYLVLRRMSLLGDAISHAVLPGLAAAFLLTGTLTGWPMIVGAMVLGVLTAYLTGAIHHAAGVAEDAGMGVVFTSLFAIGVILITRSAGADLDPGCVLYGLIEFTALDTVPVFGIEVPRALQSLGFAMVATTLFVGLLWKELKIVSFDPALAAAMGIRVGIVHYLLMAMVAGVTVASFEAVGSILVIAMLIVPGATGHLLSDRLTGMMIWSAIVAAISAVLGYLIAAELNTSVAGMMAVVAGGLFSLAVIFAPRHGLLTRWLRRSRLALRIAREDLLADLYRREESPGRVPPSPTAATGWVGFIAGVQLLRRKLVERSPAGRRLTASGRNTARELVRTHRLWETYLSDRLGLPADHVHGPADRVEHHLPAELREQVAAELADPPHDPHGRGIPETGSSDRG